MVVPARLRPVADLRARAVADTMSCPLCRHEIPECAVVSAAPAAFQCIVCYAKKASGVRCWTCPECRNSTCLQCISNVMESAGRPVRDERICVETSGGESGDSDVECVREVRLAFCAPAVESAAGSSGAPAPRRWGNPIIMLSSGETTSESESESEPAHLETFSVDAHMQGDHAGGRSPAYPADAESESESEPEPAHMQGDHAGGRSPAYPADADSESESEPDGGAVAPRRRVKRKRAVRAVEAERDSESESDDVMAGLAAGAGVPVSERCVWLRPVYWSAEDSDALHGGSPKRARRL